MSFFSLLLLILTLIAAAFSFGLVNGIRWLPAQIAFGLFLILFILSALSGFTPSHQIRIPRRNKPED